MVPRRNVHVFSSSDGAEVAGFFQHGGVSISTFIGWINEVCSIYEEWALYPCKFDNNRVADGAALDSSSADELQPGRYVIRTSPPNTGQLLVQLTTDVPRTRAYSCHTPDNSNFVTRVRARDQRCCITGRLVAADDYTGFEVSHIFPLSETDIWNSLNYKRFIEDDQVLPGFEMNSVQQGFLCWSGEHRMFDDYSIGVNPDDNYRIYDFVVRDPSYSPHGKTFYRNLDEQPRYLPSPDLLRDHFRQCILRHVKGAGEVIDTGRRFDPDIDLRPGGFDLASGGWWSTSEGKKQLEAELRSRLWGAVAQDRMHDVGGLRH
ncbi:hypothetical protein M378DRAFT_170124 [Amanita muscaria Koide BX008]|uniref:HNH nuclease domain-containing protein n=1 Tax=Amanita muscaria (strain Koide BX008) TaxID=946122 RepID=A0A0C2WC13_AMAMK|nr:hypothetical protein M378DRAFT_170124 [Amanita muscaria Koide BX008]